ncbi:MAG TPA: hypothetical protein VFM25_11750, partial [Verrucomicrobiae bacterium]|nr:hypothetical protein [Verrucomicrobiae bacterium]
MGGLWHRLAEELMRGRALFFVSLGVNVLLAVGWIVSARRVTPAKPRVLYEPSQPGKTNVVVRRQAFMWSQIESPDYPTFVANLRDIGCPEQTIRDIIIADVNSLYAKRLATEIVTPEQQWWRSQPDTNTLRIASEKIHALDDERRALLTRLLGPDWESGDMVSLPRPSRPGVVLDGPVLGYLPSTVKQQIEEISSHSTDQMQTYLNSQREQGKEPDPAELARMRQQTRDELSKILTPAQLEEYLLRYSQNATNLRNDLGEMKYFNATPDEFRQLFRATDSIDQQLELLAGKTDPNSALQRNQLEQQRINAIKIALGPERFSQYALLQDPAYRNAYAQAEQAGTPEAAQTLYQINLATAQEQASIRGNTNLTSTQREIELKRTELEQLKAAAEAMGQ